MLALVPVTADFVASQSLVAGRERLTIQVDSRQAHPLSLVRQGRTLDAILKKEWKPWALQVADVDGDGRLDVAVGIVKRTRYITQPHACLWIFGVRDGKFVRKWLGSTMGRRLLEFTFANREGKTGQPLFTLERTMDDKTALSRYRWAGFGFQKVGTEKIWIKCHGLQVQNGRIVVIGDGLKYSFLPKEWK